jgi:hypothetical protein
VPDGRYVGESSFSPDGSRFVTSCPDEERPCLYDTASGHPFPVNGAKVEWAACGWDVRGNIYFRDMTKLFPQVLWRVDPVSGRATHVAELMPEDRAGLLYILGVHVSRDGGAWAYNVVRRLSDLHVVTGVK